LQCGIGLAASEVTFGHRQRTGDYQASSDEQRYSELDELRNGSSGGVTALGRLSPGPLPCSHLA
jgi:hypothetical protein